MKSVRFRVGRLLRAVYNHSSICQRSVPVWALLHVLFLNIQAVHASPFPAIAGPGPALAKRVVQAGFDGNGSLLVRFEYTLKNTGISVLQGVQLTDDLAAMFPGSCQILVQSLSSADYQVNTAFNGTTDKGLLKPGVNTMPAAGTGRVLLAIRVSNCGGNQSGPGCDPDMDGLTNAQESAFGTNPALADTDKNGVPDGVQIAGVCNYAKITDLLPGLAAEVAGGCITRVRVVASKGKQYAELRYRNNTGCPANRPMTWFDCTGQAYCNDGGGVTFPTCDPSFMGDMVIVKTIYQYGVQTAFFDPQSACPVQQAFSGTAMLTATDTNGQPVSDRSTDGLNPDPNGDGDPSESVPTQVGPLTPKAQIGLAQQLTQTSLLADGSTLLRFEFTLKNLGNVQLSKLSLTHALAAAFPGACALQVTGLSSASLSVNPAFNGKNNTQLLADNNELPMGTQASVQLSVRISGCGNLTGNLSATATATGISNAQTSDVSHNGANPDPDGDGDPTEAGENEMTPFDLSCWVGIQCPGTGAAVLVADPGKCTASLMLPAAVPEGCKDMPAAQTEYRLSGAGAEGIALNTWLSGQPGRLSYYNGYTKVEYRASVPAMPWLGYSGVCAAHITVNDGQAPQPIANLPDDLTVDCNAVPAPPALQWRDNCTAAGALNVAYSETTTRCSDPGQCCYYNYTLQRSWRVTDQSGNTYLHVQKIQVLDRTAPSVQCRDKTLVLSSAGTATLTPADINAGSSDLCSPAGNLALTVSSASFQCSDAGSRTVVLQAADVCGNLNSCSARITVNHPPFSSMVKTAVEADLGTSCRYELTPADLLTSNYSCFTNYLLTIDRTPPYGDGPWEAALLTTADLGKTAVFRLQHPATWSIAYGTVSTRDRVAPALSCPPDLTIQCSESWQPARTGTPTSTDCQTFDLTTTDDLQDLGSCSNPRALLRRSYTARDASGNLSRCTQQITIRQYDPAVVVFPADVALDCQTAKNTPAATEPAQTGVPVLQGTTLATASFCGVDVYYTDTQTDPCDGTYSVIRVWNVLNKCAPLGPNNPLKATQSIRIINNLTPVVNACTLPDSCDQSDNDPAFWRDNSWTDKRYGGHDLPEMSVDLKTIMLDSCPGATPEVQYLLWLDTDNDGNAETVVNSASLPPDNVIFYGNAGNAGFTGGQARPFDQRFGIDPALDRYRFALQIVRSNGQLTAAVRFNTLRQPGNYVLPVLPHGQHKIRWRIVHCGKETICESNFIIKDCKAPLVRCKSVNTSLQASGLATIAINDVYESITDNCSPISMLKMGLTSEYLSHGVFPRDLITRQPITTVTLSCADMGTNLMQLWGEDAMGNADFCTSVLYLQDPLGKCGINSLAAGDDTAYEANPAIPLLPRKRFELDNSSLLAAGETARTDRFQLSANQPNPFDTYTQIGFYLPEATTAVLSVYGADGALLYRERARFESGAQSFLLQAAQLPVAGLLYYRVETALGSGTGKMVRLP